MHGRERGIANVQCGNAVSYKVPYYYMIEYYLPESFHYTNPINLYKNSDIFLFMRDCNKIK